MIAAIKGSPEQLDSLEESGVQIYKGIGPTIQAVMEDLEELAEVFENGPETRVLALAALDIGAALHKGIKVMKGEAKETKCDERIVESIRAIMESVEVFQSMMPSPENASYRLALDEITTAINTIARHYHAEAEVNGRNESHQTQQQG